MVMPSRKNHCSGSGGGSVASGLASACSGLGGSEGCPGLRPDSAFAAPVAPASFLLIRQDRGPVQLLRAWTLQLWRLAEPLIYLQIGVLAPEVGVQIEGRHS